MNDDEDDSGADALEQALRRGALRPAGAELRTQVLAAVSTELAARRSAPRHRSKLRILAWSVAASVAVGIALNVWAMRDEHHRDATLCGARPPLRSVTEIASAVRSVTDVETGALFEERLQALCRLQEQKVRRGPTWPLLSTQMNSPG